MAELGNQLWKLRQRHGRKRKYEDEDSLWLAGIAYFEWCEAHPLKEQKHLTDGGKLVRRTVKHLRPMTIQGLCAHLGISDETWNTYRRGAYQEVCELVENIMYEQKLSGASAGLMSANLMARYLGLADKQDIKTENTLTDLSDEQLDAKLKALLDAKPSK